MTQIEDKTMPIFTLSELSNNTSNNTTAIDFQTTDPNQYQGTSVVGRYMWHAAKEINHFIPNISAYAKLMVKEFARLEKNEITIEEFDKNTPNIEDETPLNYIQRCIVMHYPK